MHNKQVRRNVRKRQAGRRPWGHTRRGSRHNRFCRPERRGNRTRTIGAGVSGVSKTFPPRIRRFPGDPVAGKTETGRTPDTPSPGPLLEKIAMAGGGNVETAPGETARTGRTGRIPDRPRRCAFPPCRSRPPSGGDGTGYERCGVCLWEVRGDNERSQLASSVTCVRWQEFYDAFSAFVSTSA